MLKTTTLTKIATLTKGNRFQNNEVARAVSEGGNGEMDRNL